jgi:pimeloyl-ACP methyl ester carboxylesterase
VKRKAVIAHGAASTADFVRRTFGEPLQSIGYELVTWDRRTAVEQAGEEFAALVANDDATIVGGVSVGAILAVNYALRARDRLAGLLVALPPPVPNPHAELPSHIDIEAAAEGAVPWVGAEIRAGWSTYGQQELLAELTGASRAVPPTMDELRRCDVPTGIVALADDPVHPVPVAEEWALTIPTAELEVLQLTDPSLDVSVIGAAAVRAWQRAVVRT